MSGIKKNLDELVHQELEQELTGVMVRIQASVDPYSRFVSIEDGRIKEFSRQIVSLQGEIRDVRREIRQAYDASK